MNKTSSESLQQTVKTDPPSGIARRRILRAGLAAPVVLVVSGRSAMAGTCLKGLSPLAWNSLAPGGTNCNLVSHTVDIHTLGKSPGYWTPNGSLYHQNQSATFQGPWPDGIAPFTTITFPTPHGSKIVTWEMTKWNTYKGLPLDNPAWNDTGTKFNTFFTGSLDTRSFSQILIADTAAKGLHWHLCAAYLNALAFPGTYAMSLQEVLNAYSWKIGSQTLTTEQAVKDFLDQTWG
jgi:hypothetical protein